MEEEEELVPKMFLGWVALVTEIEIVVCLL